MKMHNWIFKNGSSHDIVMELARLTKYSPDRLVEAAAHIAIFRPNEIQIALGNQVWCDGILREVDCEEPSARLEVWLSTDVGDHVITVDI